MYCTLEWRNQYFKGKSVQSPWLLGDFEAQTPVEEEENKAKKKRKAGEWEYGLKGF